MRQLKNPISFTPHTPRFKLLVVVLTIAFMPISTILFAQSVILDSLPVYEESYRLFMIKRWAAEREEFVQTTRKKWWYFLPNIGYSLNALSVTLNTGVLAQIDYNRTQVRARLESMDARYQVEFVETLGKIRSEYRKLIIRYEQLERERLALKRLTGIARIHSDAFNAQTMAPEESLRHAYEYDQAINTFRNKESEFGVAVLEFHNLCRYHLPDRLMIPVVGGNCIVETDHDSKPEPSVTVQAYPSRHYLYSSATFV